jgi:protocatechuate 3,4-dioxygenase alpha subunit
LETSQPTAPAKTSVDDARAIGLRLRPRGTGTVTERFVFHTVKPGAEAAGEAPHINGR